MPDEAHEFGLRLRNLISRRGLTQADVARRTGSTQASISRYCRGERLPSVRTARRLKRVLKCSWEDLLGL